mmetsp:Transcript_56606/g.128332  ORF Transcript_56606/g.128332 Transcript_56606/m.128332 type:complete len:223 (-) Transcript_56606:601-1269(-)
MVDGGVSACAQKLPRMAVHPPDSAARPDRNHRSPLKRAERKHIAGEGRVEADEDGWVAVARPPQHHGTESPRPVAERAAQAGRGQRHQPGHRCVVVPRHLGKPSVAAAIVVAAALVARAAAAALARRCGFALLGVVGQLGTAVQDAQRSGQVGHRHPAALEGPRLGAPARVGPAPRVAEQRAQPEGPHAQPRSEGRQGRHLMLARPKAPHALERGRRAREGA